MLSTQEQLQWSAEKDELFTCMHEDVDQKNTQVDRVKNHVATHPMLLAKKLLTYDTYKNSDEA